MTVSNPKPGFKLGTLGKEAYLQVEMFQTSHPDRENCFRGVTGNAKVKETTGGVKVAT